jgi:hypothetical protein
MDLILSLLILLLIVVVVLAILRYVLQMFAVDPRLAQLIYLVVGVVFLIWLLSALMGHAPLVLWRVR